MSCLLFDNSNVARAVGELAPEDFYSERNREIFTGIAELHRAGAPVEMPALAANLKEKGLLAGCGGVVGITDMACGRFLSPSSLPWYIEEVKKLSVLRKTERMTRDVSQLVYEAGGDPQIPLTHAAAAVSELNRLNAGNAKSTMGALVGGVIDDIYTRAQEGAKGIPSGFGELDGMITGWQPGHLIILAGRPSMGKTALALSLALNAAHGGNLTKSINLKPRKAIIFSLEMSKNDLIERMLSTLSGVDAKRLQHGDLDQDDYKYVAQASAYLCKLPLRIYDGESGVQSVAQIEGKIAQAKAEGFDAELVIIDHLSYLNDATKRDAGRNIELEGIVIDLHNLAIKLGIPFMALSQLSREVEKRGDKRPMLSDLRDSGGVEQVADDVLMIYRDDYYKKDSPQKGETEIIIAKQRNGPTGTVSLLFKPWVGRFFDFHRTLTPLAPSSNPIQTGQTPYREDN